MTARHATGAEDGNGGRLASISLVAGSGAGASLISVRIAVSVALVEIVVGVIPGKMDWVNFLADGAIF
jgi:hypothetical protein